jgi:predicted RNase H-like nuclease
MSAVIGVDGCPGGWIAVRWPTLLTHHLCSNFAMLALDAAVIAVDSRSGSRSNPAVPSNARCGLSLARASQALFSVPSRAAIQCMDYRQSCAATCSTSIRRRKSQADLSHLPKMREIDAVMTPDLQARVFEVHPEGILGDERRGSLPLPKKVKSQPHRPGLDLRRDLLIAAGFPLQALLRYRTGVSDVGADDCRRLRRRLECPPHP